MMNNMETKEEIESRKEKSLKFVNEAYYNKTSIHYKDDVRYAWAVDMINEEYDKNIERLKENESKGVLNQDYPNLDKSKNGYYFKNLR